MYNNIIINFLIFMNLVLIINYNLISKNNNSLHLFNKRHYPPLANKIYLYI